MGDHLFDAAVIAGVTVVTMAVVNRSPLAGYVTGSKKILGVI